MLIYITVQSGNNWQLAFPKNNSFLYLFFCPDVINAFELESILIYTALLLKKRVAVYHSKVEELLDFVR